MGATSHEHRTINKWAVRGEVAMQVLALTQCALTNKHAYSHQFTGVEPSIIGGGFDIGHLDTNFCSSGYSFKKHAKPSHRR